MVWNIWPGPGLRREFNSVWTHPAMKTKVNNLQTHKHLESINPHGVLDHQNTMSQTALSNWWLIWRLTGTSPHDSNRSGLLHLNTPLINVVQQLLRTSAETGDSSDTVWLYMVFCVIHRRWQWHQVDIRVWCWGRARFCFLNLDERTEEGWDWENWQGEWCRNIWCGCLFTQ